MPDANQQCPLPSQRNVNATCKNKSTPLTDSQSWHLKSLEQRLTKAALLEPSQIRPTAERRARLLMPLLSFSWQTTQIESDQKARYSRFPETSQPLGLGNLIGHDWRSRPIKETQKCLRWSRSILCPNHISTVSILISSWLVCFSSERACACVFLLLLCPHCRYCRILMNVVLFCGIS